LIFQLLILSQQKITITYKSKRNEGPLKSRPKSVLLNLELLRTMFRLAVKTKYPRYLLRPILKT